MPCPEGNAAGLAQWRETDSPISALTIQLFCDDGITTFTSQPGSEYDVRYMDSPVSLSCSLLTKFPGKFHVKPKDIRGFMTGRPIVVL